MPYKAVLTDEFLVLTSQEIDGDNAPQDKKEFKLSELADQVFIITDARCKGSRVVSISLTPSNSYEDIEGFDPADILDDHPDFAKKTVIGVGAWCQAWWPK